MKPKCLYIAIFLLISSFAMQTVSAQNTNARIKQLETMIEQLQKSLLEIKAEMAKAKSDNSMKKGVVRTNSKEDITVSTTGGGLKIKSSNGNSFKFGGRILYDYDSFDDVFSSNGESHDESELRRTRLTAAGSVGKDWKYKFTVNIDDAGTNDNIDTAYIQYAGLNSMIVTVGKFKEPFGLERLTSSKWISTIERSLMTDVLGGALGAGQPETGGVMLSGYYKKANHFKWAIGVFDDRAGDGTDYDAYSFTSRLAMTPSWDKDHFLHLGLAYSIRDLEGDMIVREDRFGVHTADKVEYFSVDNPDKADQLGLEVAYVRGPFSIQAEYLDLDIDSKDSFGSSSGDMDADVWYGQLTYTLTGETRGYNMKNGAFDKIKPTDKFGAWELVARYEDAEFDYSDSTTRISDISDIDKFVLGVNWYANNNIKFSANYVDVELDYIGQFNRPSDDDGDAFSLRAQYVW